MGLEVGTQIGDLVPANPPGSDPKSQGDDHIRLIKTCVQGSLGDMQTFWTIPTIGPGLQQRNAGDTANINLINLDADDDMRLGASGVNITAFGNLTIAGQSAFGDTMSIAGKLTITADGATITGDVRIFDGLVVDLSCTIQQNLGVTGTITSGGELTVTAGGATITGEVQLLTGSLNVLAGTLITTGPDNETLHSVRADRGGTSADLMYQMHNRGGGGGYREFAGIHLDATGAIRIGGAFSGDTTFSIVNNTINMGLLPASPAGLNTGDFYRTGTAVNIVI